MKRTSSSVLACLVAGLAFVSMPGIADADPKHCPPGHAKKGWCKAGEPSTMGRYNRDDDDRDYRRHRDHDHDDDHADRRHRDRDHDDDRWRWERQDRLDRAYEEGFRDGREYEYRIGERIERDRYRVLDRDVYYDRYGRPLDDRYYYAEVDGRQLLIEAATDTIIDILSR